MEAPEDIVGVLLAPGRSGRIGGGDKCLLPLAASPILACYRALEVSGLVISANGDPARFSAFGLPVVEDRFGDYAGPPAQHTGRT
jgi:molybdenum cofactor guanylyltransferase